MGSYGPCNKPKCSWCVLINKTSTFTDTRRDGKVFDIFHTVNCQSTFVIYIIECRICRLQYVGKSETAFNLRLNNHRNHIKRGVNSCELSEHFLHNSRSHDFGKSNGVTWQWNGKKKYSELEKCFGKVGWTHCNRTVLIREWARTQSRIYLYKVFST